MTSITEKRCKKCGETKPIDEFYKNKIYKDGRVSKCRKCYNQVTEKSREWARVNRSKKNESMRRHRSNHPEKMNYWAKENKERYRELVRNWADTHKKERQESERKRERNPEERAVHWRARRARKKGSGGKITAAEWQQLKHKYNYTCLRCGRKEPEIVLTLDHVIPISSGGNNTIDNAQPLCGSCNSVKHTKTIDYR